MRRILALLLFSIAGYAQTTTTVTGTIKDLSGAVVTSGQVTFQLQPGFDTTISGSARFSPSIVTCGISGAGAIKALDLVSACTVTWNTALIPQNSYYKVCIQANFVAGGACFNWYALVSSFDLTTAVPTPGTAPAFTFVDLITSQTISGNKTFSGVNTFSAIPVFPSGISGTAGQTLSLPSAADTLVGRATTDTLTNKTIAAGVFTGTETHSGQIQSSLATGTAPLTVASTTPVSTLVVSNHPQVSSCDGLANNGTCPAFTAQTAGKIVQGSGTLSGGASTINGLPFASTGYNCVATDDAALNPMKVVKTSASIATFTGTGGDTFSFICAGN